MSCGPFLSQGQLRACYCAQGLLLRHGRQQDRSYDSRFWGFVKKNDLIGRALVLYFSLNGEPDDLLH